MRDAERLTLLADRHGFAWEFGHVACRGSGSIMLSLKSEDALWAAITKAMKKTSSITYWTRTTSSTSTSTSTRPPRRATPASTTHAAAASAAALATRLEARGRGAHAGALHPRYAHKPLRRADLFHPLYDWTL